VYSSVLLHNGNKLASIPIDHSTKLKEEYQNIKVVLERIALKCHMIYIGKSQLRIVWIATNHNLIKRKFSLGKISDIIALGKNFFGRFSSEYTSGQIYIARNFFLQSNTRVCRSKLPSGWSPRVIFLRQTLVCQDCSKKFPATHLSLGILYMNIIYGSIGRLSYSWHYFFSIAPVLYFSYISPIHIWLHVCCGRPIFLLPCDFHL
jgi:hypothetical protein